MYYSENQTDLFIALFNGRKDVFAKRWETKDKSGYAPAYDVDWDQYSLHKASGGTLKDYPYKTYSKLTVDTIKAHLEGKEVVGIYPLLENNTSWFIVIDFDEGNWKTEILQLLQHCSLRRLTTYIERSRSGNGGHLWIFFEQPYPAIKSRGIIKHLLKEIGISFKASDISSYDRIFPNQDFHTGKGLGNLIALPLQMAAIENGNTCFVDPNNFEPYLDQWDFLSSIQRVSVDVLNAVYEESDKGIPVFNRTNSDPRLPADTINVELDKQVTIGRDNLPPKVVKFLRKNLKINKQVFFVRKANGQSTFGMSPSTTLLEEKADRLIFPRGYIGEFLRFCKANGLMYILADKRVKLPEVEFEPKGRLYDYQQPVLLATSKKEMGVIVAPPGAGKTVIGLSVIAQKKQSALIIVHRRQLLNQWIQQIEAFLGIPKYRIGRVIKKAIDIGEHITIAMVQSLNDPEVLGKVEKQFGTIIIDECHHLPAETYQTILRRLNTYYLYGLTATPVRKDKDEKMIFAQVGGVIQNIQLPKDHISIRGLFINIKDTDLNIPFNPATDKFETVSGILIHDTSRNNLIICDILTEINNGKSILVLTERKAHIEILNQFLKQHCETIIISGDDNDTSRRAKTIQIEEGRFQVLITTGQYMGEGIDIGVLDCLFLVYPCSFEGKLIQYIGRVQRSENAPVIYDYRDLHIPYLEKMFQKRNKHYNKLTNSGLVKSYEEYIIRFDEDLFYIGNQTNAYPISVLDLPMEINHFEKDITWKIRVLNYQDEENIIFAEILNYNFRTEETQQFELPLLPIERIKFRTIDTAGLLKSVILKKSEINISSGLPTALDDRWWVFEKVIKVAFQKVLFGNGCVTVPYYLAAIKKEIILEIQNAEIRQEFELVKNYFSKILKTKSITITIEVKHDRRQVLTYKAFSEEVQAINTEVIDSVKFEFVKKDIMKFKGIDETKTFQTFDDLKYSTKEIGALLEDEVALMSEVLKMEFVKHSPQIKYLAEKHEASILKLRFILQPFSFIFLVAGENKYHLVWETLDTEEATYLWHIPKDKDALRGLIKEIEISLKEMKQTGRNSYVKNAPDYFSRIIHDYSDAKKGFIDWKGLFEERLV